MKIFFSQADASPEIIEEDFSPIDLKESIRKTRQALEIAYAGSVSYTHLDVYKRQAHNDIFCLIP